MNTKHSTEYETLCNDGEVTGTELRAAQYCYARFIDPALSPVVRAAFWDAYRILSDRQRRTKYLPITNSVADLSLTARSRHCGRFTMEGTAHDGRHTRYVRLNCKCWNCQYCGPRKAKKYKMTIGREAERLQLCRMLTLTLDPKKTKLKGAVTEIKAVWARFRAQLRKRYGKAPNYICVMEFQHETKMPHLHVMIDRYIEFEWMKRVWEQAGGGSHVHAKGAKSRPDGFVDVGRIAHYLSKYLTAELLTSAPKRSRRVTTSKAVTLNIRPATAKLYSWEMVHENIFVMLYRSIRAGAAEIRWATDSILESFTVPGLKALTATI